VKVTVSDVLNRFLSRYLKRKPVLHHAQHRVIWAITHCRTPAIGGHLYYCDRCSRWQYAWHSCNNRSCPRCGKTDNAKWVGRQLEKRVGAPYFMVTFTLPCELRRLFIGKQAKDAYNLFFTATSKALAQKLASQKGLRAETSGFTGVLQTWDQRQRFHPHIHYIVPGAGLDRNGEVVQVKNGNFLVYLPNLKKAFRWFFRKELRKRNWKVDPSVWKKEWGVHIQPAGAGAGTIKYLGAYVCRRTMGDSRIVSMDLDTVSFRWKNRDKHDRIEIETICGEEFVARFLRHVLPIGFHVVRHYGFHHPAAKAKREKIAFYTGQPLWLTPKPEPPVRKLGIPKCSCCHRPMRPVTRLAPLRSPPVSRTPPQKVISLQ
jgi:hypothetical protein